MTRGTFSAWMALLVSSAAAVTYAQSQPEWEIVRANAAGAFAPDHKDYIPKEFGRLVSAESIRKGAGVGVGDSWLWFEAPDGAVREWRFQSRHRVSKALDGAG
jgi:hypothetical protein